MISIITPVSTLLDGNLRKVYINMKPLAARLNILKIHKKKKNKKDILRKGDFCTLFLGCNPEGCSLELL